MKLLKNLTRFILAGVVAVIILSILLTFYSLTPVHIANSAGNTDYVWPANSRWIKMTEGVAWGQYDANGFNNEAVINNPDIIILGSSHMEATNVMQDENIGQLLNQKFAGKYTVYNMGISGHNFFKVCQYLQVNLSLYDEVPKAVIIETSTVNLSKESVNEVLQSSVEYTPSHSTGIIAKLQGIPFLRLLYHQIKSGLIDLFIPARITETTTLDITANIEEANAAESVDLNAYSELFEYLHSLQEKYRTEIIIFYHPSETLNVDGTIGFKNNGFLEVFASTAKEYGITFIDMTDSFEKMYYESHHVPHGFINGLLGSGHLNAYGHAAIADRLFDVTMELEEDGALCR